MRLRDFCRKCALGLLLLMYGMGSILYANDNIENDQPSLEFLEFLGSFESENGQWLDPLKIEKMFKLPTQQVKTQEKNDEQSSKR